MPKNDVKVKPEVSIIILNFNGGQHILNCIESIYKTTKNFEIILIDNNSTDNSENIFMSNYFFGGDVIFKKRVINFIIKNYLFLKKELMINGIFVLKY